jgi:hypothetical protein
MGEQGPPQDHSEQSPAEDARERDPADGQGIRRHGRASGEIQRDDGLGLDVPGVGQQLGDEGREFERLTRERSGSPAKEKNCWIRRANCQPLTARLT